MMINQNKQYNYSLERNTDNTYTLYVQELVKLREVYLPMHRQQVITIPVDMVKQLINQVLRPEFILEGNQVAYANSNSEN